MSHTLMECLASPVQGGGMEHPHQPPQPDNKKKRTKVDGSGGGRIVTGLHLVAQILPAVE